jgi:hypothetical protein
MSSVQTNARSIRSILSILAAHDVQIVDAGAEFYELVGRDNTSIMMNIRNNGIEVDIHNIFLHVSGNTTFETHYPHGGSQQHPISDLMVVLDEILQ